MNTARIATVAALAVALLVPVSAPAASAASPVAASGLAATAAMAPAGLVAQVKSECKQVVSKKQAKKWKTLKPGTVSPKARWVNRALAVSSSKTYTPQTAKAVRAFERAVKLKANGTVSARDWCMLKALAKVKGPGSNGGNGNGGNGNGGSGGTTPGTDNPFNSGLIDWGGWGESSPQDTLQELRSVETSLSVWIENSTDPSKNSIWHASGPRVEEAFMGHAVPLLAKVQGAVTSLAEDIGTAREQQTWKNARIVWHEARLFDYAMFQAWNEGWLSGDTAVFMDLGSLNGGATYSYERQITQFRETREAYATREDADPGLLEDTDRSLAWAESHLLATLTEAEDHLVAWLNAAVESEKALVKVAEDFQALAEWPDGKLIQAGLTARWFRILSSGGDPRDSGLVAP